MGSISNRGGLLYFDFRFSRQRCREYTKLADSPANRSKMESVLKKIEGEIALGTFEYSKYFPRSAMAHKLSAAPEKLAPAQGNPPGASAGSASGPLFSEFIQTWKNEKAVEWRRSYIYTVDSIISAHLVPAFGTKRIGEIDRAAILAFRADLAKPEVGKGGEESALSPATVNRVMGVLRQVMDEGAARHAFTNPCLSVKRLKVPRGDIHPFSIEEVKLLLSTVRQDYRNYLTVRVFTGMRSGEVHGLKWKHVDFERRQILVRETWQRGRIEYTKNDGSQRDIAMAQVVFDALQTQHKATEAPPEYVFCNRARSPIDNKNFTNRVWRPLLRHLGLKQRRPYQMRHTCATLWLAAGENPEWIARQLGHTTTEMLFRVYSRYVPNLTRQDGSAFDRLLTHSMQSAAQ